MRKAAFKERLFEWRKMRCGECGEARPLAYSQKYDGYLCRKCMEDFQKGSADHRYGSRGKYVH